MSSSAASPVGFASIESCLMSSLVGAIVGLVSFHPSVRSQVEPFRVMSILGQCDENSLVICVGQPASGAPAPVISRAESALIDAPLGYTATVGTAPLRQAIASWQGDDPANVVVTTGSSGGFVALFLAALDPGDVVAMTRPGYPAYRNTLQALGARIVDLPCGPQTRFQPTAAMLEALPEVPKAVIVTSPDNPTGTIIDPVELEKIAKWCECTGCLLISDEIYHGITYGRRCASAREFSDKAVVVGSLSKFFCMTGWRLGWLIVPDELVEPLENLQANLALCPPAIAQEAALAAFTPESIAELEARVAGYSAVRDILLDKLPFSTFAPPDGGFYLYVDVSEYTDDSETWCRDLLRETGVALAPGVDFDPIDGHRFIRISFCVDPDTAREACKRITEFCAR